MPVKNIYPGKFIVFEGIDGSGKTTAAKMTADFLREKGYDVYETFEPTKESPAAGRIRNILESKEEAKADVLQELFIEDRAYHVVKTLIPALGQGKVVICDRYFFSTFAYGMARGLEKDWFLEKHREILGENWILPDLTVIIDALPEIAAKRITERKAGRTIFEKELELAEKLRRNYLSFPDEFENVRVVDGNRPPEEVLGDAVEIILPVLKTK